MGSGKGHLLLGSPERENDSLKCRHRRAKCDYGPTSVITRHNCVGAVAYVRRKRLLKVELLSVQKWIGAKYYQQA
jgi:hypothetical protein